MMVVGRNGIVRMPLQKRSLRCTLLKGMNESNSFMHSTLPSFLPLLAPDLRISRSGSASRMSAAVRAATPSSSTLARSSTSCVRLRLWSSASARCRHAMSASGLPQSSRRSKRWWKKSRASAVGSSSSSSSEPKPPEPKTSLSSSSSLLLLLWLLLLHLMLHF